MQADATNFTRNYLLNCSRKSRLEKQARNLKLKRLIFAMEITGSNTKKHAA